MSAFTTVRTMLPIGTRLSTPMRMRTQTSFFSTSRARLTNNTPNPNPSYPTFSLKRISPNPRVRMALGAGLVVLAAAEGYAWVKFWPKISGKGQAGEE